MAFRGKPQKMETHCVPLCSGMQISTVFQKFPTFVLSVESQVVVFVFFLDIITLICSKISFFICSFPNTVSRN